MHGGGRSFFTKEPDFFLATMDGDQPRVRPFGAVSVFEGKLYLITSNQKAVFAQIQANPRIELCAVDPQGPWLRMNAKAVVDHNRAARVQMLKDNPALRDRYAPDDGHMEVFYLQGAQATFYAMTSPPHTSRF